MAAPQSIFSRLFWFAVGGGMSVAINWIIYYIFEGQLGWPKSAALAVSLGVVTTVFAIWNYRINFRTDRGFEECLVRYLIAIAFCFALNYGIILTGIKKFGTSWWLEYGIIAVVQVAVSGVKFLLYHHWVYPRTSRSQSGALPREAL
jgi:putative flippase GtrA